MGTIIELEKHDTIARVILNRPQAFNAFNLELVTLLAEQMTALAGDNSVRGVVLTGKGKAFCAGGDLKWALNHTGGPAAAFHTLAGQFSRPLCTGPRARLSLLKVLVVRILHHREGGEHRRARDESSDSGHHRAARPADAPPRGGTVHKRQGDQEGRRRAR